MSRPGWLVRITGEQGSPRLIAATTGLACLLIAILSGLNIHRDYQESLDRGRQRTTDLAVVLEANATRTLRETEAGMRAVHDLLAAENVDAAHVTQFVRTFRQTFIPIEAIYSLRGDGQAVGDGATAAGAALLAWARRQPLQGERFTVGEPLQTAPGMPAVIPLLARFSPAPDAAGSIVVAAIRSDFLKAMHRNLGLGADALTVLVNASGVILARAPSLEAAIGRDISQTPMFNVVAQNKARSVVRVASPADGVDRLLGIHRMRGHPLSAVAGFEYDTLLAPWRARVSRDLALDTALILFVALLGRMAWARARIKQALRERIRASELLHRSTLASLHEGVTTQSADGDYLTWNDAALRILGVSEAQIRERATIDPRWRVVDTTGRSLAREAFPSQRAWATGAPQLGAVIGVDSANGERRWLSINSVPVVDEGRIVAVVASYIDITEQRGRIEEIQHLNATLEARVEQRTEALEHAAARQRAMLGDLEERALAQQRMIHILSHDLREPLNGIINFTRMIEMTQAPQLTSDGKRHFDFISGSARRMKDLLDDLLKYVRLEKGELVPEAVPLGALLENVNADLSAALARTGTTFTWEAGATLAGDKSLLRVLFQNLVANAAKFVRPGVAPRVHVRAIRAGANCAITVEDNGIGIPADKLDGVFALFSRLHGREKFEGTGLGLAIVRRIATLHGGEVTVASTEGAGSCFTVTLPLHGQDSPKEAS